MSRYSGKWKEPLQFRLGGLVLDTHADPHNRWTSFHRDVLIGFLDYVRHGGRAAGNAGGQALQHAFEQVDAGDGYAVLRAVLRMHHNSQGSDVLNSVRRHRSDWTAILAEYDDLVRELEEVA